MRKKCFLKTKLSTRWSVTEGILTLLQHLNNRVENDLVISLSITVLWTCWLIVRVKEVLKRDCCRCGIRFSSAWKKVIIEAHIVKTTSPIIAKENLGTRCFPVRPDLNHSISIFPYLPLGPPSLDLDTQGGKVFLLLLAPSPSALIRGCLHCVFTWNVCGALRVMWR